MNKKDIEKYSSAITLSDMEIFIFPELLYSLVLANIMSPVIWAWRENPWFKEIDSMTPYRRTLRLKQFVMDNFDFNLDLGTWGLTTKEREISRFEPFLDEDIISKSNALFGYEGDKYYFDIDIRKHFGIDRYKSNVVPYWKTETIEAMEAFKYKDAFKKGAGECVSISTLYAAALFIICKIPLQDIYLLATPLHSQNFIDIKDGLLTNNRRLVTKNMWFNGTKLTIKAQRAMRNEKITIVSHNSGYVHTVYPDATINKQTYDQFEIKLQKFLVTDINYEILTNFLRQEDQLQNCFQINHIHNGKKRYIGAEKVYDQESISPFRVAKTTLDKLLSEIDESNFYSEPLKDRIFLNKFIDYFKTNKIDFHEKNNINKFMEEIYCPHIRKNEILASLFKFANLAPRLPGKDKNFIKTEFIDLTNDMERMDIIFYLESIRAKNNTADLAFYAYRDLSRTSWDPFIKAAIERNPVSIEGCKKYSNDEVINIMENMSSQSIYDYSRLAQPDEVWNYQRGDGLERAICLGNILKNRNSYKNINIYVQKDNVTITLDERTINWLSNKGLEGNIKIDGLLP